MKQLGKSLMGMGDGLISAVCEVRALQGHRRLWRNNSRSIETYLGNQCECAFIDFYQGDNE